MFHNSEKWMDDISIMNGLIGHVSQDDHGILQVFQFSMHVSHDFQMNGGCFCNAWPILPCFHKMAGHFNNIVVSFPQFSCCFKNISMMHGK
jgi:hypothetical protein